MKIVDIYLEDELIKEEPVEKISKEESAALSLDEDTLMAYVGVYELQAGFNVDILLTPLSVDCCIRLITFLN